MASLRDWYTGQLVAAQEMRAGDVALESAMRSITTDLGFVGVYSGFGVVEHAGTPNMSVDVAAGLAYTANGERLTTAATSNVSLAFDYLGNPTTVQNSGKSKILAVYAIFDRVPSDPRIDATNTTIYFQQDEGVGFDVVQGAEATVPSAPGALADGVLLALVTIAYGQTAVHNSDISTSSAATMVKVVGSPFSLNTGSVLTALSQIVGRYNNLVNGTADNITAAAVTYAGSGPWADSNTIAAGNVEGAIDTVVSSLASTATSSSGARKIGVEADTGAPLTLAAGGLQARLSALRAASNLSYAGGGPWADLTTNGATSVEAAIDGIISDLGSVLTGGRGTGAAKIGIDAMGNFTTNTVRGYFAQLVATTSGNDGAVRIGAEVTAGFTAGTNTVRQQLDDLQARKAPSASPTFSGSVGLTSRSITRLVGSLPNPSTVAPASSTTGGFSLPNGAVLTAVAVNIIPSNHTSYPPSTKTSITVGYFNGTTGVPVNLGTGTDGASNLSQINAPRAITLSPISHTVDRTTETAYFVQMNTETGTGGTVASTQITSIAVTFTVMSLDDGFVN